MKSYIRCIGIFAILVLLCVVSSKAQNMPKSDQPVRLNEWVSCKDYQLLMDYLNSHQESELYNHFSGAYLDNAKNLIINLSCGDSSCLEVLESLSFGAEPIIRHVTGSYFANMQLVDQLNKEIAEVSASVLAGNATQDEQNLISFYPIVSYDCKENKVSVMFTEKKEDDSLSSAVRLFELVISRNENVIYTLSDNPEKPDGKYHSTPVQPGEGVYIYGADYYSSGFRAYYDYDGVTHQGFVTAAHYNSIGQSVALCPYATILATVGSITRRVFTSNMDAAFVEITNGNYSCGSSIYYNTSYDGSLNIPASLNGNCSTPPVGATLYKSGGETHLTVDTVDSVTAGQYFEGQYRTGMIRSKYLMTNGGDSGGIAFRLVSGNSAVSCGIVLGSAFGQSYFTKATECCTELGILPY